MARPRIIRKPLLAGAATLALLVSVTSCGGGGGGGGGSPAPTPPPSPTPTPTPTPTPGGTTLFVAPGGNDSNAGTQTAPLATLQAAVDRAGPGTTISVAAGTYTQQVLLEGPSDSGTASDPIRLSAEAGVIIDGAPFTPSGRLGMITLRNVEHVTVSGFDIRNFQTPVANVVNDTPVGILVEGSGNAITIENNRVSGIANRSTCAQGPGCAIGANGIAVYGTTTSGIQNLTIRNNEVFNNTLAASEAVPLNGNVNGFLVEGNVVRDNNNIGFDFIGFESDGCASCSADTNRARNGLVRGNQALRNSSVGNPWYAGDTNGSAGGFYVDGGRNIVLERNIATGNDIGIELGAEAPGRDTSDILVASNLIYSNGEAGLAIGGFSADPSARGGGSATRIQIANNTLFDNIGFGSELFIQNRVSALTVVNNIFVSPQNQSDAVAITDTPTNTEWRNNLWWADGAINGVPVPDSSPLSDDPQFVNRATGNVRLQDGSPAEGMGGFVEDITSFTDPYWNQVFTGGVIPGSGSADLNGDDRIQGAIDIGATEKLP